VFVTTLGNLVAHRNHERKLHGWATMAWSMGYGALASLIAAVALGEPLAFDWSPAYLLSLLYLVVFGSILAFAGFLELLGRIGPSRASYIGVMVPIVALFISSLFEGFNWQALTFAGVAVFCRRECAGAGESSARLLRQASDWPLAANSRMQFRRLEPRPVLLS
jgi:drug/metabolite transporter (DMT)-like permease